MRLLASFCIAAATLLAQQNDIPGTFAIPKDSYGYVRREVMVPMPDGVKLDTVIMVPKGAKDAPIVLTRTPYNASNRTDRSPQTFVPNIFYAKPSDYVKATQSVFHSADQASAVWLPVL